jgi:hypothetical protein
VKRVDVIESLERRTYFSKLTFSAPTRFATGSNPSDLVAVDLSNRGVTDIVTTDFTSDTIAVLRGNGNGTFQPPVLYPVGTSPEALAVGDFNGDGFPDIVTANEGSNTISVLMGNGDGTFAPAVTYAVGLRPEAIAVSDLTGSGHPDIVVANQGSDTVSVLLNTGTGAFDAPVSYFTGAQPDGVAIADLNGDEKPDIVTVNPLNNNLHVLLNNGDGTFGRLGTYTTGLAARAVTIADVNSDGRPDIITTNLHDTTISLLEGIGNGTFQSQQTFGTGSFPFGVTVADVNGDGRPDIITIDNFDNAYGVLLHNNNGSFSDAQFFHAGNGPVALVAADVNGDGKPDLIAADFNSSTIAVDLNQTVFVPLIPTTLALTPGQNPVEVKNRLELSVQLTPESFAKKHPVGLVQFFDGDRVIGVVPVSANGTARIFISSLIVGSHSITAHYAGDGVYHGSLSSAVVEVVVPATEVSPLVSPTISAVKLPSAYVAGDRGVVELSVNDIGDGPARGTVDVQLFASLSTSFDAGAFPIAIDGNTQISVNLPGGRSKLVGLDFTVPTNLEAANYTFFAALAPSTGFTTATVNSIPAVGLTDAQSVLAFGAVGAHRGYRLTRALSNGASVTLGLTGPGTGVLTEDAGGGISLLISGTSGGSALSIVSTGVTLDSLTDAAALGSVVAPTTTAGGAISLTGSVRRLTLAGADNSNIFLGGGVPNVLSLGTVTSTSLYSAAAIHSLTVNSYSNTASDVITTAWIQTLRSAGDFGASMNINGGTGPRNLGLTSVIIGGSVGDSVWSVLANVGTVQAASFGAGWSGSIHGAISQLIDTGDFAGELAALDIGQLHISGNLTDADLLAGADFGSDGRLGNNNDFFGKGILTSLVVNGSVTNSVVAAGLSPVGTDLLGPGATLLKKSAIRAVTISGTIDPPSRFLAAALPAKVSIDGILISSLSDPNFDS